MSVLVHDYLNYHAQHNPHNEAVSCLNEKLTYLELHKKANQLAHRLIESGIKPGNCVGIYMDKCLDMSVAIYGILKAGAVYVPLDPFAPVDRLVTIINDCDISVLLSHKNKIKRLPKIMLQTKHHLFVIGVNESNENLHAQNWQWVYDNDKHSNPNVGVVESDLAYIIYTSGSTGTPKGIMHTHHSCLSYVKWAVKEVNVQAHDRLGNHCPLHFDISIFDWFGAAVAGASTIIIPDEYTKLPASYSELIASSRMTVLFTVPFALIQLSQYGALEQHDLHHLRWITFAGEPMPAKHLYNIMQQLPWVVFDNMYGPAETNVCTHYRVTKLAQTAKSIPIGKMCEYAQALVVNEIEKPVASNEIGELWVCTPTMMAGYWARPDLDEKVIYIADAKTVKHNTTVECKQKFYRTGDLVQVDDEGIMWFIGRKDRQVKVRGYRIELDEIEAILVAHQEVEEAAVYTVLVENQATLLHATFTIKPNSKITSKDVKKYLKSKLPPYAVPSSISIAQTFPRTSSDKIDRNKLSKEALVCL